MIRIGQLAVLLTLVLSCGADQTNRRLPLNSKQQGEDIQKPFDPQEAYVVRGRVLVRVGNAE